MRFHKIQLISAVIAPLVIIGGALYLYAKHRTDSPKPPADSIDLSKGVAPGTVFKLVATDDPNSKAFIGDPFTYAGLIEWKSSLGPGSDAIHLIHVSHGNIKLTQNNGYAFVDPEQQIEWIKAMEQHGLRNTTEATKFLVQHTWVYKFEDTQPGANYGKYLYAANFWEMLHVVDPNFQVPTNENFYTYK